MLITELGAADPLAESLCSVAVADTYHAARGNNVWIALGVTEKEVLLRRATDYATQTFRRKWAGVRRTTTQALDWPRNYVPRIDGFVAAPGVGYVYGGLVTYEYNVNPQSFYPSDSVPREVVNACAELALRANTNELQPDEGPQEREVAVGPIRVVYEPGARATMKYTAIEKMLLPFLVRVQQVQLVRG